MAIGQETSFHPENLQRWGIHSGHSLWTNGLSANECARQLHEEKELNIKWISMPIARIKSWSVSSPLTHSQFNSSCSDGLSFPLTGIIFITAIASVCLFCNILQSNSNVTSLMASGLSYGNFLLMSWNKVTPSDQQSTLPSYTIASRISGADYRWMPWGDFKVLNRRKPWYSVISIFSTLRNAFR